MSPNDAKPWRIPMKNCPSLYDPAALSFCSFPYISLFLILSLSVLAILYSTTHIHFYLSVSFFICPCHPLEYNPHLFLSFCFFLYLSLPCHPLEYNTYPSLSFSFFIYLSFPFFRVQHPPISLFLFLSLSVLAIL